MGSCKEFELDDVLAVTAIPVFDYHISTFPWQLSPVVDEESFSPTLTNAIVIGWRPAVHDGGLIPIVRQTGKAKDNESDGVAGRKHSVSVSCDADDRDSDTWPLLRHLEYTPCHLLLTFRGGTRAFVAASEDTYTFDVERSGGKTSVTFKIENLMGMQLIVR